MNINYVLDTSLNKNTSNILTGFVDSANEGAKISLRPVFGFTTQWKIELDFQSWRFKIWLNAAIYLKIILPADKQKRSKPNFLELGNF